MKGRKKRNGTEGNGAQGWFVVFHLGSVAVSAGEQRARDRNRVKDRRANAEAKRSENTVTNRSSSSLSFPCACPEPVLANDRIVLHKEKNCLSERKECAAFSHQRWRLSMLPPLMLGGPVPITPSGFPTSSSIPGGGATPITPMNGWYFTLTTLPLESFSSQSSPCEDGRFV